ncbi:hypothetical protein BGX21_008374 [Mortierella sp. AD011]|nr:hypothetical protein BGX20_008972 [Mortierella sp. AD010]KAF9402864.1 hypothetical protein BGX21_008374 [Mortierella sp. AD011]
MGTSDPANNNAINDLADNDTAITIQTDPYYVLGLGCIDRFYPGGCLFGNDPDYLGEPFSGNVRDRLSGDEGKRGVDSKQKEVARMDSTASGKVTARSARRSRPRRVKDVEDTEDMEDTGGVVELQQLQDQDQLTRETASV